MISLLIVLTLALIVFGLGITIVEQTTRGVVERLGKYHRFLRPGFHWVIPLIEQVRQRNITERMSSVEPQDIITKDNLNARVDLVVYHKVKDTEKDVTNSYYNVENYKSQIIMLSQTTARNVIGDMRFVDVNSQRNILNRKLAEAIDKETESWGIRIVRVELKEITPPKDVQETMNKVIKAQNEKEAAVDFATAVETQADGARRSEIKKSEGIRQSKILEAEGFREAKILEAQGEAQAIQLVNESAEKYFVGNAQIMKQLEVALGSMQHNSKIVISSDILGLIGKISEKIGIKNVQS